jgi:hypothetical protein
MSTVFRIGTGAAVACAIVALGCEGTDLVPDAAMLDAGHDGGTTMDADRIDAPQPDAAVADTGIVDSGRSRAPYRIVYLATGSPFMSDLANDAYVLDETGEVLHVWDGGDLLVPVASPGYLRPDGLLIRAVADVPDFTTFPVGAHGVIQLVDWDGAVVWEYDGCESDVRCLHHDVEPMPDGNIVVASYVAFTSEQAEALGRVPDAAPRVWLDSLYEIRPNLGDGTADIVWEWHASDHLVQDADATLGNYGVIADAPGRLDANYATTPDVVHFNSISYHPTRDELLVSSAFRDEIYVIDHGTTTAEASGSTGGPRGQGGDLLYRWGNPAAYGYAGGEPTMFASWWQTHRQHDARWLLDGTGRVSIHNNTSTTDPPPSIADTGRAINAWTQLFVITLPYAPDGSYERSPGEPFGPAEPVVLAEYDPDDMLLNAPHGSGFELLPDGSVFGTNSAAFILYEIDASGRIVFTIDLEPIEGIHADVFKAQRLPVDFPGLARLEP